MSQFKEYLDYLRPNQAIMKNGVNGTVSKDAQIAVRK